MQSVASGDRLFVNYVSARLLKAGGYGKESRYDPYRILNHGRTSFISTSDEIILREACVRKMMFDNAGKGKLQNACDLQALFEPLEG